MIARTPEKAVRIVNTTFEDMQELKSALGKDYNVERIVTEYTSLDSPDDQAYLKEVEYLVYQNT